MEMKLAYLNMRKIMLLGKSSKKERGVEQAEEGKGGAEQEQGEGGGRRRLNSISCRRGRRGDGAREQGE